MNLLKALLYPDLPDGFKKTFGDVISYRKHLKNGWQAVKISNGAIFFIHPVYEDFNVPSVKKIDVVDDGKFLVENQNGDKVVYAPDGQALTPFDKFSELYPNGWYVLSEKGGLSLYNEKSVCLGKQLKYVRVFKCGAYQMCVNQEGDARCAGVYSPENKKIYFTNRPVKVFKNGWFLADNNTLCDNLGDVFIEPYGERKVPNWLLALFGRVMPVSKN